MKPFIPQKLPLQEVKWEPLIPLIGKANRSLAQYDGVLYGVPNPDVLLSPLTTQEAVLSSKIEGTQATLGEVLKFEAGEEPEQESRRLDIQEIINYRKALRHAEKALERRPFNLNLILELHDILLDSVRGRNKGRGQFRRIQNYIGTHGAPIEQADFVPPDPMILLEYLDNWEKYYHADRPGRVEGWRASCRWRVSSLTLSITSWVHISTMTTFPAPASSNAAGGFPALRFPANFT